MRNTGQKVTVVEIPNQYFVMSFSEAKDRWCVFETMSFMIILLNFPLLFFVVFKFINQVFEEQFKIFEEIKPKNNIYCSHGSALSIGLDFGIMLVSHKGRAPVERVGLLWILMSRKIGHSKHTGWWFQTKQVPRI